ncbi:MAG: histidine kinase [Gemmatirosa sp.]|nr:histidine kinase [Gemmatirosa sp.]
MPVTSPVESAPSAAAPDEPSRAGRVAVFAALWTLLALLSVLQTATALTRAGVPFRWPMLFADRFADWYTCALFTPAYFWLARHAPITRRTWASGVAAHVVATMVFVVLKYPVYVAVRGAIGLTLRGGYYATLVDVLSREFITECMTLWAVAGVVHAVEFHRRAQEREAHAERLRAELAAARLDALAEQLRPHFLFNTLNTVSSLMHRDVEAADRVLARLGDLLRRTLRAGDRHEVSLAEELDTLADYVAIVTARFRDRLTVDVAAEPGTERAAVPHFVLQPLVENALEHGIARRAGAGRVEVRATRTGERGERLRLVVTDDGVGLARGKGEGNGPSDGIGLTNTRRRLAALYGATQRLTLADRAEGGLEVTVELPYRSA